MSTRLELVNLITINKDGNFKNEVIVFFIPKINKEDKKMLIRKNSIIIEVKK